MLVAGVIAVLEAGRDDDDSIFTGDTCSCLGLTPIPPISSCCSRLSFPRVELKERKIRGVTTPNRLGREWHAGIAD